jgi:hypothetical protein
MRPIYFVGATLFAVLGTVIACSSDPAKISATDAGTEDGAETPTTPTPTPTPVTTDAAVPTAQPIIYAHSPTTLYRFDTTTNALTKIGDFSGCTSSVTDLAVAADGTAFVSTFSELARVSLTTAVCTPIVGNITGPSSLAFVPNGAGAQQLVAYFGGTYDRIDPATANTTPLGGLTGNDQASGDIANLDGGTFVSVIGDVCDDCLFQINPLTGVPLTSFGDIGTDQVYGLAASSNALYAFTGNGIVIRAVPLGDGGLATAVVFDAGTPAFYGAASGPAQ